MIARAARPPAHEDTAANPLRRGETVICPRCEAWGSDWEWELKRSPRYAAWTAPCYRCRSCQHVFALAGQAPRTEERGTLP